MRHSPRRSAHASIATTMVAPSASANTGSEVSTRQPPHDSATSPVWSATHAAPAAASAINTRNRMTRYIEFLWRRFGERRHGVGRKFSRCGKRRVARVGLVDPGLRGGATARAPRRYLAPGLGVFVAQRRRGDPRDDGAAVVADTVGALDADQLGRARLQAIDQTA